MAKLFGTLFRMQFLLFVVRLLPIREFKFSHSRFSANPKVRSVTHLPQVIQCGLQTLVPLHILSKFLRYVLLAALSLSRLQFRATSTRWHDYSMLLAVAYKES